MNAREKFRHVLALAGCLAAFAPAAPLAAQGDVLVQLAQLGAPGNGGPSWIYRMALPNGPQLGRVTVDHEVLQITALGHGQLAAVVRGPFTPFDPTPRLDLYHIAPDGSATRKGAIEPPGNQQGHAIPLGFTTDAEGRLFLLARIPTSAFPPASYVRLAQLDPETGATLQAVVLPDKILDIYRAPEGLWAYDLATLQLRQLDPDRGEIYGAAYEILEPDDADSTGALWGAGEAGVCSPPCLELRRFDPATGSTQVLPGPPPIAIAFDDVAIERRCEESATSRCLLGGRFRAEITWKDPLGQQGAGQAAHARSPDTALFYFFEPANWELQIKVLDGCAINGNFWVFAAASTNVEYHLKVTDLQSGHVRIYDNPLGHKAEAVDDTAAFACSP